MPYELFGLEQNRNTLNRILREVIHLGQNRSTLLTGPRSSGKTSLINSVIRELREEGDVELIDIWLNGRDHHEESDAQWETLRQLRKRGIIVDKNQVRELRFLSQLLSHVQDPSQKTSDDGSGSEDHVHAAGAKRVIVIVLEEFDLFVTIPKKQTMLYSIVNDLLHSGSRSHVVIIATTCRIDVMELLEKRVRSRFTPQEIYFYPLTPLDVASMLKLQLLHFWSLSPAGYKPESWEEQVNDLCSTPDFRQFVTLMMNTHHKNEFYANIIRLGMASWRGHLTLPLFEDAYDERVQDIPQQIISSLSTSQLGLLIAMKRLKSKSMETFSFEDVFHEWDKFCDSEEVLGGRRTHKSSSFRDFETLHSYGLSNYTSNVTLNRMREYIQCQLLVTDNQIEEGVKNSRCPTVLQLWATQWTE
ncbi:hypothetical protein PROFUN_01857 [Planoprotostelium fungivorum]|uniref:Origin recognition complex subunit 4 n=1 Tax=Planoprotostelium fungivorum TaxID=1890364 RepID=A0A2P6NYU9_9EUKA|nr:hypothetical protein PROFUN_01857 [Planoprotostelium fungivorum]